MSDIAIRVDNLSKLYPELSARACHLGAVHQRPDTLRDALTGILPRIARIARKGRENSPNTYMCPGTAQVFAASLLREFA